MMQTTRLTLAQSLAGCALLSLWAGPTSAQDGEVAAADSFRVDSAESLDSGSGEAAPERGVVLLGGKVGGIASFNGLDPFVHGALEVGYVFPALDHSLGAYLQIEYSAPSTDGKVSEDFERDRVPGGAYSWNITHKELVFAPTFLYRLTTLSKTITPYVGIGPRIYLIKNTTRGKAGDAAIDETHEESTKWGLGLPLGAEVALGPGKVIGELMFQWGPLKHTLTGDTHLGGASLLVGYRAFL